MVARRAWISGVLADLMPHQSMNLALDYLSPHLLTLPCCVDSVVGEYDIAQQIIDSRGLMMAMQVSRPVHHSTIDDMEVVSAIDPSIVVSLDIHRELSAVFRTPCIGRSVVLKTMVKRIVSFVAQCPEKSKIGVHGYPTSYVNLKVIVDFFNELSLRWPVQQTLHHLYIPLSESMRPPTVDPKEYTRLVRLSVPKTVKVIVGICHPRVTVNEIMPVVSLVDAFLYRQVVIGPACDMSLLSLDDVRTVLSQQRELCRATVV